MTIGERIKQVRALRGMSRPDLAAASGVKYPTLAGIENNDQAGTTQLPVIAAALGVHAKWLQTGKGPRDGADTNAPEAEWADVTGYAQAVAMGDGAVPDDYAETHKLKFKASSLRRKGLFARNLAVYYGDGDSMEPRIRAGDALLFDTSDTTLRDDEIYIVRYDGHYMAKRLQKIGGRWFLVSDNKEDPKWRRPLEIDEMRDFEVIGRVRWIGSWEGD